MAAEMLQLISPLLEDCQSFIPTIAVAKFLNSVGFEAYAFSQSILGQNGIFTMNVLESDGMLFDFLGNSDVKSIGDAVLARYSRSGEWSVLGERQYTDLDDDAEYGYDNVTENGQKIESLCALMRAQWSANTLQDRTGSIQNAEHGRRHRL